MPGVLKAGSGTISPNQSAVWWMTIRYPNNNPDVYVDWWIRPVHPPGHATHSSHIIEIVREWSERTPDGWVYWYEFKNPPQGHFTEFELLGFYQEM